MDQLAKKIDNHEGRLSTLEQMAAEAAEERAKTNKSLAHLESLGEQQLKAFADLTEAVKSQNKRNDLQDTELAELRKLIRLADRAKTTGKWGGLATVLYAAFELWQQFGG